MGVPSTAHTRVPKIAISISFFVPYMHTTSCSSCVFGRCFDPAFPLHVFTFCVKIDCGRHGISSAVFHPSILRRRRRRYITLALKVCFCFPPFFWVPPPPLAFIRSRRYCTYSRMEKRESGRKRVFCFCDVDRALKKKVGRSVGPAPPQGKCV